MQTASTIEELETVDASNALLLLHGDIAREPLMPKNYPFFNVDEHKRIIALLESSGAAAILCAVADGKKGPMIAPTVAAQVFDYVPS